ncbi:MAG: hypothetical protein QF486_05440 [Candidatus Woesearchaeota archaeon]|jgi:hypothetical protein|nr:hypothetical protein [Candidatus Woesearchaeota archaeon]MDP7181856.1 hypothetical protein [Candidatus Woesearchaeota archaeon]MDP7199032.1 hypothetical protein [Candidatus Woesearchaeota archaeon]MDP7467714.1 hypothetical protein [Candidatus Woesearchaeota archaeon]MDP7646798.1 hypothetical protein [Candidatus Woesearchaeota archaeon]
MDPRHDDLLKVLKRAARALKAKDYASLSAISNQVVHNAILFQDNHAVHTAIVLYALGKIAAQSKDKQLSVDIELDKAIVAVEREKHSQYEKELRHIMQVLRKADNKVNMYTQEALDRARVKKGYKLHTHGLSVARTAKLVGVSQWELQGYLGKTVQEEPQKRDRLAIARKLFTQRR